MDEEDMPPITNLLHYRDQRDRLTRDDPPDFGLEQDNAPITSVAFEVAQDVIAMRRNRLRYLPRRLFGEPGWDMLLTLYAEMPAKSWLSLEELSASVDLPPRTANRWLEALKAQAIVEESFSGKPDEATCFRLTAKGTAALTEYLTELSEQPLWSDLCAMTETRDPSPR